MFITYRQTLALDITRNFGKLQVKNYLDACNDPSIWDAPRLNIQIDSLINVLLNDGAFINGDEFDLRYDIIVLDKSESLMNHFDKGTMNHKILRFWYFLTQISKYTPKMVLMDGDISQRSLRFASSFGKMLYVRNNNNETNKEMHVINDPAKWEYEM